MKKFLVFIVATIIIWIVGYIAFSIFAPTFSIDTTYGEIMKKSLWIMMFCYGIPLVIIEVLMLSKWSLSNDFWGSGIVLASLFIAGFMDNAASYIVFYIGCGISLLVTVIQLDKLK